MSDPIQRHVADLLARQTAAVEQHLAEFLAARGIDPGDRTPGWEDRAREALADVELHETLDWSDDYRATITTTIRPRSDAVTVQDDHARMTYSPSKGATFQPRNRM